jgi:hypothetical protein|tara:strand:+ start:3435 stop:3728 length:294 start_codon:yes stop_codon:yes gene_type:complete
MGLKIGRRTARLRNKVEKYLKENGSAPTGAIYDHINNTTRHGTTMNVLGNILAKDPRFKDVGTARIRASSSSYTHKVWELTPNFTVDEDADSTELES